MAGMANRRLLRDFHKLCKDAPEGISASPQEDDIFRWTAVVFGPEDTPWEGGAYELDLRFKPDYPATPPSVTFTSEMFHPNISQDGQICLDILRNKWSSSFDVSGLLLSIQSILADPGIHKTPEGAMNPDAERLYLQDRREYDRRVSQLVEKQLELAELAESQSEDESVDTIE